GRRPSRRRTSRGLAGQRDRDTVLQTRRRNVERGGELSLAAPSHAHIVPKAGVEPARGETSADFESAASANSATSARFEAGGDPSRFRRVSPVGCAPRRTPQTLGE